MKAIPNGHVVKNPAKESTAQWKPSVASLRGTKGLGAPKMNPLQAPKGETASRVFVPNQKK